MRRVYTKPYLIVESFQLNAAVATSCATTNLADDTCSYTPLVMDDGESYFGESCDIPVDGNVAAIHDEICYQEAAAAFSNGSLLYS